MPLYKTITIDSNTSVAIWKVTESEETLWEGIRLSEHCQNRFNSMKSTAHRRAFLSIRHLLAAYAYQDTDLWYDANGKPHLTDGNYISITHSYNFTGVIISKETEVGIDIEKQRDKILRIAHKFTPFEAYKTVANSDAVVRKLTLIWGVKEAIYKILSEKGLSFLRHIDVEQFLLEAPQITAKTMFEGVTANFKAHFLEFEGFTCVYAMKEIR